MTSQHMVKSCDGGHSCFPPKECCKPGCCYPPDFTVYRPPVLPAGNMFSPLFLGHWYFWAAITATVAGILCACSLWRRHSQGSLCCRGSSRDERASEPDSNGSCYIPPQYSRCSSFHQAPPPYSEVTSKPDLYPLVITCNGDTSLKSIGNSTGYLMVQYFRNFIVRPVGTLSATSTIDSLSSSFICNATNEANTVIPPPYSCTGSLEEVTISNNNNSGSLSVPNQQQFPRSASSLTCNDYQTTHSPSSARSHLSIHNNSGNSNVNATNPRANSLIVGQNSKCHNAVVVNNTSSEHNHSPLPNTVIRNNPCYVQSSSANYASVVVEDKRNGDDDDDAAPSTNPTSIVSSSTNSNNVSGKINRKLNLIVLSHDRSVDSESQEDDHNFSDLLNLSVCAQNSVTHIALATATTTQSNMNELRQSFSVTNSMTSSDISSLANLGTPDSPPRATSPTVEMKELLDKIQQLPQQKSPSTETTSTSNNQHSKMKNYFNRCAKAKTLYMPLKEGPSSKSNAKVSPISINNNKFGSHFARSSRCWLSRSAPNTPCGSMTPSFPSYHQKRTGCSQSGSKAKISDDSPLLNENEESDDDHHKDECL